MAAIGSLALSYTAGALSTLSPCVLPLLPVLLVSALEQHALAPLALAVGLSGSFAAIGILIASLGLGLGGLDADVLRYAAAALMAGFGIVLLIPDLQTRLTQIAAPLAGGVNRLLERLNPGGIGGQFMLGVLLGAVWSPCAGPTLGAAVAFAAQGGSLVYAAAAMALFAFGAATPILALAYGSRQTMLARRDRLWRLSGIGKPAMGVALAAVGLFVLTGLDKVVEANLTRTMPGWLMNATTWL